MHSKHQPPPLHTKSSIEYIKIYTHDVLYNHHFLGVNPEALPEVIGVWALCMTHCQLIGKIPRNITHLARLLRVAEKPVQRVWPFICFDFEELGAEHYRHPRIDRERQEAVALSEKRRQSALCMWNDTARETGGDPATPHQRNPRRKIAAGKSLDLSHDPLAMRLLEAWNQMAESTGDQVARASVLDLPADLGNIVEELGGEGRILKAIERIPKLPFYLGAGPHGWKASLPWVFQRKSITNLLAQTPGSKATSTAEPADLSDADRALLDQLREDASASQGRP